MRIFSLFSLINKSTFGSGIPFAIFKILEAFQILNSIHLMQDDLIQDDPFAEFILQYTYFAVIYIIYIYILGNYTRFGLLYYNNSLYPCSVCYITHVFIIHNSSMGQLSRSYQRVFLSRVALFGEFDGLPLPHFPAVVDHVYFLYYFL